jgi:Kef-type K+ transport system membrane component KefB
LLRTGLVSPLGITALLFLVALILAEAAARLLRVPRIAALVVAGASIGWLRATNPAAALMPLPSILLEALAMVLLFEVGQRVPLSWLRRNPWLVATSLGECALTFAAIYALLALVFFFEPVDCAFIAALCMTASPIVVMSVSKDLAARGQVSERALLYATLSSVYGVLLVQVLVAGYRVAAHVDLESVVQPVVQIAGSFLLGTVASLALRLFATVTRARDELLTLGIICCCVLLYAYAPPLGLSPILSALFFGLVVRATDRTHRVLSHETSATGRVITIAYFVLVGASLPWFDSWFVAGIAAAVAAARLLAKIAANAALASPSALSAAKGALVGVASAPLSSLALSLVAGVARQPELARAAEISGVVVALMAIVGPVLTELSLRKAGEPTPHMP